MNVWNDEAATFAEHWAGSPRPRNARSRTRSGLREGMRVLDVGCGERALLRAGASSAARA